MKIGHVIRHLRKSKSLTLEDLAHHAGTTASYISRVETGRNNLSPELLESIAAALGVTVAAIYVCAEELAGRSVSSINDLPTWDALSKREASLLNDYNLLSSEGKSLVDVVIRTLKKQVTEEQS